MIDIPDPLFTQWTVLHKAIDRQDCEVAGILLEYGAKIDVPDVRGRTPYFLALEKNFFPGTMLLLQNGAEVDTITEFGSLLHIAVSDAVWSHHDLLYSTRIIDTILNFGINIDTRDKQGRTALHMSKNVNATKYLLQMNANINAQDNLGNTALHYAITNNIPRLVEYLLSRSPNLDLKNREDITCLYLAVQGGYEGIVASLLKFGADAAIKCKGESILYTSLKTHFSFISVSLLSHKISSCGKR